MQKFNEVYILDDSKYFILFEAAPVHKKIGQFVSFKQSRQIALNYDIIHSIVVSSYWLSITSMIIKTYILDICNLILELMKKWESVSSASSSSRVEKNLKAIAYIQD